MQIVFLKQFKSELFEKNTILKEFKPKGKDNANEFYINIDRRLVKIEMASVNIVQAKGDYIHIKTEDRNYVVHSTLKKIEDKLPKDLF
jgi:DNA-binding LytR/AlgR family response regulator